MESWRNRKTLILSRTEMMGLLTPAEYNALRRAGLSHAWRAALLHGSKGAHRAGQVSRRVGGDALLHRGARGGGLQMGVDPRAQPREARSADGVLDPDLHPSRKPVSRSPFATAATTRSCAPGSAAAVSAKWLARKDSKVLAIVGAGHMAEGVLATCNEVFRWEEVRVWSRSQKTLDQFVEEQQPKYAQL